MGFCNRCGEILNDSKCKKCGGKSVDSLAKGGVDSYKSSAINRWQNQYANNIIAESNYSSDTSVIKHRSITISTHQMPSPISKNSSSTVIQRDRPSNVPVCDTTQNVPVNDHHQRPSKNNTCRKCFQPISGPSVSLPILGGDTWYYHYDCLTCTACGDVFTESEFVANGKDIFHIHCSASLDTIPPYLPASPPASPHNAEPRMRFTVLPKLGGSRICPSCHTSISIMEESRGPLASRWHKKCLKCTGCKKQMDSCAKMTMQGSRWFVHCHGCLYRNTRRNYVSIV